MSLRTSGRSNKGHNRYLQSILDDEKGSETGEGESSVSDESVRCAVCRTFDYNYDAERDPHGDMVQCDRCNTWQHIKCMSEGKDMESLLDADGNYYCEKCRPEKYENRKWWGRIHAEANGENVSGEEDYLTESEPETDGVRNPRKRRKIHGSGVKRQRAEISGDERLRENAQKMLYQLFDKYIIPATVEAKLYSLPDGEDNEKDVALEKSQELEKELYKLYPDHSNYTERVRTIFSNLKDAKNLSLKSHVIKGHVKTSQLVRMSATELANPDLQQFREKIDEQSLTQLVVEQPGRPKWIKTHKGEELIENLEENNNNELEPEMFTGEGITDRKEPDEPESTGEAKEPTPTIESAPVPTSVPPLRVNIKYPELAIELNSTVDYIGSSTQLSKNPQREALGDGKLVVEGRLSKLKVLKYLSEMQSTRAFLLYRVRPDENCLNEFNQIYEFLWQNEKISGIQNKRSYQKNIYLIPSVGYDHDVVKDIAKAANATNIESDTNTLFILTVIKPELVR